MVRDDGEPIRRIPTHDQVHEIVQSIVDLVPVSRWTFARFKGDACDDQYASSDDGYADAASHTAGFAACATEFAVQLSRGNGGPAMSVAASTVDPYAHAFVLLFADNRTRLGMLTLFRTADDGLFRSAEIRVLGFALDAACDRLSEARLMDTALVASSVRRTAQPVVGDVAYYLLDRELAIVYSSPSTHEHGVAGMPYATDTRLPQLFADTVRMLTADWTDDFASRLPGIAVPVPFLALRVHPMSGASGWCTGVTIQRLRQENALIHAAAHYRISPRELQVLARLLQGSSLVEIAKALLISSSTVQDHIKRLIEKTRSGNRSEMIANMFRHDMTA